jgi:chromosome segregation ATPase
MTNWQLVAMIGTFILMVFSFILTIISTSRSTQAALNEMLTAFRNEVKAEIESLRNEVRLNDKRYEERFDHIGERFARIEADNREIKSLLASILDQLAGAKNDINELRLNNKLYEERFARIEADLREIKSLLASIGNQQSGLKDQLAGVKYEVELLRSDFTRNDKQYEDRFARVEADLREIKNDLQQVLQSA